MRIDKDRFYTYTCKKCVKHNQCYGGTMVSCARMKVFNPEEFERHTKGAKPNGERIIKRLLLEAKEGEGSYYREYLDSNIQEVYLGDKLVLSKEDK